jgi:hypothetical protein
MPESSHVVSTGTSVNGMYLPIFQIFPISKTTKNQAIFKTLSLFHREFLSLTCLCILRPILRVSGGLFSIPVELVGMHHALLFVICFSSDEMT